MADAECLGDLGRLVVDPARELVRISAKFIDLLPSFSNVFGGRGVVKTYPGTFRHRDPGNVTAANRIDPAAVNAGG